jgi:RHS repeat-associated protein
VYFVFFVVNNRPKFPSVCSVGNNPVGTGTAERVLTYDLNGNLLDDGAGRTFTWDAANRIATITTGSNVTAFAYDGAGRRVQEKLNGTVIKNYIWGSGPQPIEERDANNAVTKRFYAGLGEQTITYSPSPIASNYFYTTDHLGSVREMTDSTGAIRARYSYTPYGERTKVTGDLEATFGFTGYLYHTTTGLNLTLYRGYDAQLGRFISRDPLGEDGGINLYGYTENDPLNYNDPLGLTKGGKQNISTGGFTKNSDPRLVEEAMEVAKKAGQSKHYLKLRGLLKVIKRGGGMEMMMIPDVIDETYESMIYGNDFIEIESHDDKCGRALPAGVTRKIRIRKYDLIGYPSEITES